MYLSERDIKYEERRWAREKRLLKRKQRIIKEKEALKPKKFTTTKLIIFFLFLNCTLIELFTFWATIQSIELAKIAMINPDFTPLITLIGTVVGEVIGFAIYAIKSMRENTSGGIVYDKAFHNSDINNSDINMDKIEDPVG